MPTVRAHDQAHANQLKVQVSAHALTAEVQKRHRRSQRVGAVGRHGSLSLQQKANASPLPMCVHPWSNDWWPSSQVALRGAAAVQEPGRHPENLVSAQGPLDTITTWPLLLLSSSETVCALNIQMSTPHITRSVLGNSVGGDGDGTKPSKNIGGDRQ